MIDRELLPPPVVIQERLARNYREASLLRSLLRLAFRATRDRHEHDRAYPPDGFRSPAETHEQAGGREGRR
jgi:hypothetical protein